MAACSYADDPPADRKIAFVPRIRTKRESSVVLTKLKEFIGIPLGFRDVYDKFRYSWTFLKCKVRMHSHHVLRALRGFPEPGRPWACTRSASTHVFRSAVYGRIMRVGTIPHISHVHCASRRGH